MIHRDGMIDTFRDTKSPKAPEKGKTERSANATQLYKYTAKGRETTYTAPFSNSEER